ncbi:F0F1 ATP synthase subunit B' [Rhodovulum sp. 12E13]|uniref:F0F1 ATP synthase subunit B' n=1 Tax=Rhodovulum sp. 12E13 TaxID=2203891 RepID=UPI000E172D8C|nr:F0F1 ATP synthase subunit B' [Rhodovulum sp. 12E13]RDC74825.1 F0F1 ATP synthase subunit B' [Rhodovulum sp. 12E13]
MESEETAGAVGRCVGPDGGAIGMPQLCFDWFPNQIFWLIVALGAIYLILTRVALPRIEAVIAERNGAITNDIAAAEELKLKAAEAERAYERALADARAEAQKIGAETRAEIDAEVATATEKAEAEIAARTAESQKRIGEIRDTAVQNVEAVAKDVAAEIVASLGSRADPAAVEKAVARHMTGDAP